MCQFSSFSYIWTNHKNQDDTDHNTRVIRTHHNSQKNNEIFLFCCRVSITYQEGYMSYEPANIRLEDLVIKHVLDLKDEKIALTNLCYISQIW